MLRMLYVIWTERECAEFVSEWKCQVVALVDVMEVVKAVVDEAEAHHEEDVDLTGVTQDRRVVGSLGVAHAVALHRVVPDPKSQGEDAT